MTPADAENPPPQGDPLRSILILLGVPVFVALFLFLPAGSWSWPRGWLFVFVFPTTVAVASLVLRRVNPGLPVTGGPFHQGTKRWDEVLFCVLSSTMLAIAPIAALDDGRFHWFPVTWRVCVVGYALLFAGVAINTWAQAVNQFFEPTVRIQTERGHKVIDSGAYAVVRHPGYAGSSLAAVGVALCLGSLWALIPAGLSVSLLILRTRWEDQTLRAELEGYTAYSERVRHRLIPGVW